MTNSLVILATKRDYQLILDVIRRVDVVPRQVVLEVMIAEVALNKRLEFGVAYAVSQGQLAGALPTTPAGLFNPGTYDRRARRRGPKFTVPPANGAFAVISNGNNFNIFIKALQTLTRVKMLSAPHIIAADNREAHILVGQSVPILTSTSTFLTGSAVAPNTANTVQYRDVGKILTVLPQVNSKGLVNLQVRQEVSAVADETFGNTNSPSFNTREAETTLVVQDGATVIIGGIIDDLISSDRTGVPYLMDVPVLGRLFRTDTDTHRADRAADHDHAVGDPEPRGGRGRHGRLHVTDRRPGGAAPRDGEPAAARTARRAGPATIGRHVPGR